MTATAGSRSPTVHDFEAMGTPCRIVLTEFDPAAAAGAERWVRETAERLTRFDAGSELSALNRSGGRWVEVSQLLAELLGVALWAFERSGGLVHAGVLPALLASGYRRTFRRGPESPEPLPPPPPPLPEMLALQGCQARLRPDTGIDLGGIAKGWMADRLVVRLDRPAVVNLGGDLYAGGGAGWPIGFAGGVRVLRQEGAATSSIRHRRWRSGAGWAHHLVDPRTGAPSASGVAQVQVVAPSALEAEVLAKQALLMGPAQGPALLEREARAWSVEPTA